MALIAFDKETLRPLCALLQALYGAGAGGSLELAIMADHWQLYPPKQMVVAEISLEDAKEIAQRLARRRTDRQTK